MVAGSLLPSRWVGCGTANSLTAVAQAGGNPVDRHMDAVQRVVVVLSSSAATQQIQLQQIERIDVRKAELNGFVKSGIVLEQLGLAGQRKHRIARDVPFRGNAVENAVRQFLI